MMIFAALLRAVNVGGTGKLAMSELRQLCEKAGFKNAKTYIQSGNVVLRSSLPEKEIKATLETLLQAKLGKPVRVLVRTAPELAGILARNPFKQALPSQVLVLFLDKTPDRNALREVLIPGREKLAAKGREIFIHFPDGMGRSKLKVPFSEIGTGRNLNTVAKILEPMEEMEEGLGM
jgi:uncharacterized protein (DUF1697 family)